MVAINTNAKQLGVVVPQGCPEQQRIYECSSNKYKNPSSLQDDQDESNILDITETSSESDGGNLEFNNIFIPQ